MKKDIAVGDVLTDFFKFKKNNTDLKTEIIAGITTFSTMAYIVAVIPNMLSSGGIPKDTAFTVTLLMTIITTFAIGIYTNRPFALGPGLGSVAIFSYTLLQGGVPLGVATGIVFFSGVVFMFVSFFGVRDFIVRVIPASYTGKYKNSNRCRYRFVYCSFRF